VRRIRAIVSGRVQGVAFRHSTTEEARRLGVVGWIKNRDDGTVELEAEGAADQISALLAWCEQGPSLARVSRFVVTELPPTASHLRERQFSITK
jgi:acylphosphatase